MKDKGNWKKLVFGLVTIIAIILAMYLFVDQFSTENKVSLDKSTPISVEELNIMVKDNNINYKTSQYISNKDVLYIIDMEGGTYKITDASKRKLDENLEEGYFKQYFSGKEPSSKLTEESKYNTKEIIGLVLMGIYYSALILLMYVLITKTIGPKTNINRSNKSIPNVKFDDVKGHNEAKRDLKFVLDFMKNPDKYEKMGARPPKGVLLNGPPGTGKTLLAKALAGEAGMPIYSASGSDFVEMFVGLGAKRVRDLFKEARKNTPCIIFIDEIDAIGQKRTGGGDGAVREHEQTLNALLTNIDGFTEKSNILVIASTNRIDVLDPAVVRPGRFDRHIEIGYPDIDDREDLAELYLRGKLVAEDVTPLYIAKQTYGFSGAMVDSLINESALIASLKNHKEVTREDISDAMLKIITGGDKKINYNIDNPHTELVAYHEAGHAIANKLLCELEVPKVSIVPTTTGALGWTMTSEEDLDLMSRDDIENRVVALYAGRASEEVYYKGDRSKITNGASNDIERATILIVKMVSKYGFDEDIGNINIEQLSKLGEVDITASVYRKSKELYNKSLEFVKENKELVEEVANKLVEKETIDSDELDKIIKGCNYTGSVV